MGNCISFTALQDWRLRQCFSGAGLKSTTTDLGDGTVMHCWVPKSHKPTKPTMLLIHGIGANAMWQFNDFISPLCSQFNVYVPDLVFFGNSYTTQPDRTEAFQRMHVVGLSYGGFVAYSIAVQFPDAVDRLVKSADEAIAILLPQKPEKLRELMQFTFYKPVKILPSCFLNDFIENITSAIFAPVKILKFEMLVIDSNSLDSRDIKEHLGENAQLVVIKNAGHAINAEKPKEMLKHLKSYLVDPLPPQLDSNGRNPKAD
ncbi:hypothetical protein C3L33_18096, partial [Rhododendron williamsianum]